MNTHGLIGDRDRRRGGGGGGGDRRFIGLRAFSLRSRTGTCRFLSFERLLRRSRDLFLLEYTKLD